MVKHLFRSKRSHGDTGWFFSLTFGKKVVKDMLYCTAVVQHNDYYQTLSDARF